MRDLLTPQPKPLGACDKAGCRDAGVYRHGGFRYCVRHYRKLLEDGWDKARELTRKALEDGR